MRTLFFGILLVLVVVTFGVQPSRADEKSEPTVKISGYFDGYYSFNFNQPSPVGVIPPGGLLPLPTNQQRYYDVYANQISLNLAEVTIDVKAGETEFLTDLDFGTFADLNASSSTGAGGPLDTTSRNIGQAVLKYTPQNSRWSFIFGKMYSILGLETAKPKDNDQYSRSYLFSYGIPFWHFGVGATCDLIPKSISAGVMVYNGWNSIYDNNNSKTAAFQFKFTPNDSFTLIYNVIAGPEEAGDESKLRVVHELNASQKIGSSWTVNSDFVFGNEDGAPVNGIKQLARWYGGLISARFQATDSLYFSPRVEVYMDETGFTLSAVPVLGISQGQHITSYTLTEGYKVNSHFEARLEEKLDLSTAQAFQSAPTSPLARQGTVLLTAMFTM